MVLSRLDWQFDIIERAHPEDVQRITSGVLEYNRRYLGDPQLRFLTVTARTLSGPLVGGLNGHTVFEWLVIEFLWVKEEYRRNGIGQQLLRLAEKEATLRGCSSIIVDTLDFQAAGFYVASGFNEHSTIANFPISGFSKITLIKKIEAEGISN